METYDEDESLDLFQQRRRRRISSKTVDHRLQGSKLVTERATCSSSKEGYSQSNLTLLKDEQASSFIFSERSAPLFPQGFSYDDDVGECSTRTS